MKIRYRTGISQTIPKPHLHLKDILTVGPFKCHARLLYVKICRRCGKAGSQSTFKYARYVI